MSRYRGIFTDNHIYIIVFPILVIIISAAIFAHHDELSLKRSSDDTVEESMANYAKIAWRYFKPGVGVNPNTGLHYAVLTWHAFTDWDLASYILAILDAGTIGLIPVDGEWGVKYRIEKVLNFLSNRKLSNGIPYWAYYADNGEPYSSRISNPSDAGRLLIALYKVKQKYPEYSDAINYIVYKKTRYDLIALNSSMKWGGGFYLYYIAHGFHLFGFDTDMVKKGLNEINRLMGGEFVNIYGLDIPVTYVTSEPIVHTILDLGIDGDFRNLADRIYLVQERRYSDKGVYTAFSEGANSQYPYYIYEWIVQGSPDKLWAVTRSTSSGLQPVDIPPIIFTKIAISFLAIYNASYAYEMSKYLASRTATDDGFMEGVDENGRIDSVITDKTNSMIINAARYMLGSIGGYTLTVRVLDKDGTNPISHAHVDVNCVESITDENGVVTFTGIGGYVNISVTYLNRVIASSITYYVDKNMDVDVLTNVFDLNLYIRGSDKSNIIVGANAAIYMDNSLLFSLISDENGYVRVNDIPIGRYNIVIYAPHTGDILGSGSLELLKDEEAIYVYLNESYGLVTIRFKNIITK